MKLYIGALGEHEKLISSPHSYKEACKDMDRYLETQHIGLSDWGYSLEPNELIIDYGSHNEFFHLTEMTLANLKEIGIEEYYHKEDK